MSSFLFHTLWLWPTTRRPIFPSMFFSINNFLNISALVIPMNTVNICPDRTETPESQRTSNIWRASRPLVNSAYRSFYAATNRFGISRPLFNNFFIWGKRRLLISHNFIGKPFTAHVFNQPVKSSLYCLCANAYRNAKSNQRFALFICAR